MAPIRVLVADDQPLVREGLAVILNAQSDIEVVGYATDGRHAVLEAERLRPDIVLMDIRMPELDGIEATRRIIASGHSAKIIVLTTFDLDEYVYAALRAGASGFLLKDASAHALGDAVCAVARGDAMLAPSVTRRLLEHFTPPEPPSIAWEKPEALTTRETDVLIQIARGQSNAEIAAALLISEQTVKTHVGRVLDKLQLRDRTQAAIYAYETGLVNPGRPA
ncbi:response regulator transcription factor [Nocardia sp. CDC159]|uniref:Response regulator transcription factor n=1 Tax=Nocardia pulmonis TaxID=2951408 RepID=A0A9X2EI12_9NOCA|nr:MULTISPECIES: response regulator transcription factor [Nocardia]MCM6778396.1 response regulator transcription factor [Nocardia pulmonis]MCM6791208.1 response regulator transcription factor [Nocardia sp. CDC159]